MTTPIDISRASGGISTLLPPAVAQEIWADMQRESVVQRLCRRVRMPGAGITVPIITSDVEAEWVDETALKPVSRSTFDSVVAALHPCGDRAIQQAVCA
ncbi:MAG TPA: phage major capsid protein [Mycobacterium sp.]|nr:phage major capsid protein [Mycobacterium sp.]HUH69662.1 phage major capsid protein [Mycobacterium sp.]